MRTFDTALRNALARPVVSLALAVEIIRLDGVAIRFAQVAAPLDFGEDGVFLPAAGVTLSTLPYELNGATTRFDLVVTATEGGTIDATDVRIGLYDSAEVSVYLMSRAEPTLGNLLFLGSMGQMTLTERGYATIECVGLLERASQLVTEIYTPVCRADFGDERCKVDLAPLTYRASVASYDGGYVLQVAGLPGDTSTFYVAPVPETPYSPAIPGTSDIAPTPAQGAQSATGWIEFMGEPSPWSQWWVGDLMVPGWMPSELAGHVDWMAALTFSVLQAAQQGAYGGVSSTVASLAIGFDGNHRITFSAPPGAAGNSITLAAGSGSNIQVSGPTLTGGQDAIAASPGVRGTTGVAAVAGKPGIPGGVFSFFANGQVIFRSGLLKGEAYEIQSNDGPYLQLFTPPEMAPAVGDVVDVIVGCDHSPFAQGCSRFRTAEGIALGLNSNALNYRGEPWAPGSVAASTLATQAAGAAGAWAPWITVA